MQSIFSKTKERTQSSSSIFPRVPKWIRWTALAVILVALGAATFAFIKVRQANIAASQEAALQTATARQGNLILEASGTGYLVAVSEAEVGFDTNGKLIDLNVGLGDKVEKGQLLAQLDDASQEAALEDAQHALLEMTSPEAIANAQLAIATAEKDVYDAQVALNSLQNWRNDALIQEYYASYVIAKDNLDRTQAAYDQANVGEYINNVEEARLYQALYAAQQAYNTAHFYYSTYSQKPTQRQYDEAEANLALAQATLTSAKNYLTALTGGDVPADATGSDLEKLRQAKLAVETAQEALDATKLYAPISGTIMTLNATVGQTVSGTILTIDDLSKANIQFYLDESDWSNVKVGYEVSVSFDALPSQTFAGRVIQVMPGLVSVQGSSMVEGLAQLDKSVDEIGLPVGVEASIDVISGEAMNAVLVPVEALHELSAGQYAVFVVENGQPTVRTVEVGLQDDTFVEIKSGLNAGEVVTTGIVETQK